MTGVVDHEFVVHLFAPVHGPLAAEAYQEVRRVWEACRAGLEMTEPIAGLPSLLPAPGTPAARAPEGTVAAQQNPAADHQGVLRRVDDALNLSVGLLRRAPEGRPERRPAGLSPIVPRRPSPHRAPGWADLAGMWGEATGPRDPAVLGEARLFLARAAPGQAGPVAATADLGQLLDGLLPYQEARPQEWWRQGTTTAGGYAVWDTGLSADTGIVRELVIIAPADRDAEFSAWVWSDSTPAIPPFARYLLQAATLRGQARQLAAWRRARPAADVGDVVAELDIILTAGASGHHDPGLLRRRLGRLRQEEARLAGREADLARLSRDAAGALGRLTAGADADAGAGVFAADQALGRWLADQARDDLGYVSIELSRVSRLRGLAAEELSPAGPAAAALPGPPPDDPASQHVPATAASPPAGPGSRAGRVWVVHGRDRALRTAVFDLLRAVGLDPLEWATLVREGGSAAPYLGQLVARAPHLAQATLVLLSPDDIVELHPDLRLAGDAPHERGPSAQARPNVLFELGLALMAYPAHTIVVQVGQMRPVSDLAGLNVIHFDGSPAAINAILGRLEDAGCPVNRSGTDWLDPARFTGLASYQRGPATNDHTDQQEPPRSARSPGMPTAQQQVRPVPQGTT